jgi:hypothetical protein
MKRVSVPVTKTCAFCGSMFTTTYPSQKFCTTKCGSNSYRGGMRDFKAYGMATGTIGSMHECLVMYDLMRRGYVVFKAQSSHSPCDVVFMHDGKFVRVESRTGQMREGKIYFPRRVTDRGRQDVFAVVYGQARIRYIKSTDACPDALAGLDTSPGESP